MSESENTCDALESALARGVSAVPDGQSKEIDAIPENFAVSTAQALQNKTKNECPKEGQVSMSRRNTYSMAEIEDISISLDTAPPPKRGLRKQEALDLLAPKLKAARERGHTLESLVALLATKGVHTHARAVSEAIARLGAAKPSRKPQTAEKKPLS